MTEKRTTVVLEAQTRGLDKAARETKGVRDGLRDLGNVAKTIIDLEKALSGTVKEFKAVVDIAKEFNKEIEKSKRNMDALGAGRGGGGRGFFQGMLQGAGVGEYFSDNSSLRSQVAGRAVGAAGRGVASIPFTGLGGMQQAVGAIPVAGGFLSGQLGQAGASAEAALAYSQSRAHTMMFNDNSAGFRRGELEDALASAQARYGAAHAAGSGMDMSSSGSRPGYSMGAWRRGPQDIERDAATAARDRAQAALDAAPVADHMEGLAGRGTRFGMDMMGTREFLGSMLQVSGGSSARLSGRGADEAMAAQHRFGLGGDVSGAFMRGSGMGAGGSMMDTLKQAMSLGLEGSDLTNYVRDMARLLMDFEQTGMPIAGESVRDMAAAAMGTGTFGSERARSVTSGLVSNARRIGGGGIGSAADFTFLRDFGGFKGGGTDDYLSAIGRLQRGELDSGGLDKMVSGARGFGGDKEGQAKGALHLMGLFKQYGVSIGEREARGLVAGDPTAAAAAKAALAKAAGRAGGFGSDDLIAGGSVDGGLQRQAGLTNLRVGTGQQMLKLVQDFEETQARGTKAMGSLVGQLDVLSEKLRSMSEALPQNPEDWRSIGAILKSLVR
jgi:hypothetical protein